MNEKVTATGSFGTFEWTPPLEVQQYLAALPLGDLELTKIGMAFMIEGYLLVLTNVALNQEHLRWLAEQNAMMGRHVCGDQVQKSAPSPGTPMQ